MGSSNAAFEIQPGMTYRQLRTKLDLVANPCTPCHQRRELEAWLEAQSSVSAQHVSQAVQHLDVDTDSQVYWYFISCFDRYAGRLFWRVNRNEQTKLLNDVFSLMNSCLHISSPLTRKVFSLHTTVLCWGASEQNETARVALLQVARPPSDGYQPEHAQAWLLQLEQCVVLMDDLQSGLLRSDACSAGVLPAACLTTLRELFFSELQKGLCGLALLAVKGTTEESRGAQHAQQMPPQATSRNLFLALDLLGKVLQTVSSAGTLPVKAADLVEVCITHLSSTVEEEAESALRAVNSICGLPMMPSERTALQQRLLSVLASSSELTQRPLMRARVARAVIETSGMNLLKLDQETCSIMHGLLTSVTEEARQRQSAQDVLCCLELWMLWLSRYADLSESNFQLGAMKQEMERCIAPFRESAGALVRTLLGCLVNLDEEEDSLPLQEFLQQTSDGNLAVVRLRRFIMQTRGAPTIAIMAAGLNPEAYSGVAMEQELSSLCIAEAAGDMDPEYSDHLLDSTGGSVAPQSSSDLCAALSGHSTSEHGVFSACIENVVSHALLLCGPVTAVEVWGSAVATVRARGGLILSGGGSAAGPGSERAALDMHVMARLASRCTHELSACSVGVVLGFASSMVEWVTRAMKQLAGAGADAQQRAVMIAVGAVFKALSALASLWVPEALNTSLQTTDAVAQILAFVSLLFELSISTIHCVLITLSNAPQPTPGGGEQAPLSEEAHHLATCASEALLAASHIAIGSTHLTQHDAAALRRSSAARALTDVCMHLAVSPNAQLEGAGHVPARVQRDSWLAFSDMFAVWPSRVRDLPTEEWRVVTTDLRNALAPFLSAWADVRAHVSRAAAGVSTGDHSKSSVQWEQTAGAFKRLCVCLASLLGCVGYLPKPARSCVYSAVEPAIEGALDVLEVAHRSGAHEAGLEGSRLMVAVVHSVLKEMPVALVERMMSVSATAPQGSDALLAQQQVVKLVWRVTDEASSSVAALLLQSMSFLLTTLDGCTLQQLAASAPLATCARQCLCGIMHMLAHRYQAMVAVDAGVKVAPCIAAQRFATFLEAAAAGNVASVHPQHLKELLEEFFDMQRVTGLYKQEEFKQVRMLLEKGIMMMLLNPIADCAKEQLLDVLWGIGSTDWDEFVGQFLVQFCSICSELVQQRTEDLVRPFTDQSGSLHDFPHFSACMDALLNDLRFFEKLAATGAPPAKEE